MLVLDSLYHRLISMPPEMSMANPPWNSALAFRPDCSWMTCRTTDEKRHIVLSIHVANVTHFYKLSLFFLVSELLMCYSEETPYLRMIRQQDETLHYINGIPGHGEDFGHEVTVALEEGDRPELDIEQQS